MQNPIDENNTAINDYLSQLDKYEIELSEQERKDIEDLHNLLKDHKQQINLSSEIWGTIKKATIDSVNQIIELSDRGNSHSNKGDVITTPLNFMDGVFVSEDDRERYEMWQARLKGNATSASAFRNDCTRFNMSFYTAKEQFKKAKQTPDSSYNNDYKNVICEKGKVFVDVFKSSLTATIKRLFGEAIKITVSETVVEFQKKSNEKLINRIKRVINNIIKEATRKLSNIWIEIRDFAFTNAISEIVNLIINYFVNTAKNIFKLIRCLFGFIIKAFKIIFDPSRPWEGRLFEALKIISAGIAMSTGTILNELIEKAIKTYIPLLAEFANDISAVISGLISSILSALVLMSFDRYKASLKIIDEDSKLLLINMQLMANNVVHAYISAEKAKEIVEQTTESVRQEVISIVEHNYEIDEYTKQIRESINEQHTILSDVADLHQNNEKARLALSEVRNESNNAIDDQLNNLEKTIHYE